MTSPNGTRIPVQLSGTVLKAIIFFNLKIPMKKNFHEFFVKTILTLTEKSKKNRRRTYVVDFQWMTKLHKYLNPNIFMKF